MNIPSTNPRAAELMGRDEARAGWFPLFNATTFDDVSNRIRLQIKGEVGIIEGFQLLGLTGGPVRTFLRRYIDSASKWKRVYTLQDRSEWVVYFMKEYGYELWKINIYFDAFWDVYNQNGMPELIYQPWTYTPEKTNIIEDIVEMVKKPIEDTTDGLAKLGFKYLVVPVLIAGVVYYVSRETIIRKRKLRR